MKLQHMPETQALSDVLDLIQDDESSLTLTIGNELLNKFFNDADKAIFNHPYHAIEIGLASMCRMLNEMNLTTEVEELFNHVLDLIQINDKANSL